MQIKKLAVAAVASSAVVLSLVTAAPASADYAPTTSDVVGVGSDTVQYAIDFMADGDYIGNTGYNATARNKVVNFDATPDANARLAYGSGGLPGLQATGTRACAPGTGGTAGTGNDNANHNEASAPCTLNPTIVLRAGTRPVLRPNGSGAGYTALKNDVALGTHVIDFSRSSSAQCGATACPTYSSIGLGTDILAMLTSSNTNAPAGGLTLAQLTNIYLCNAGYTDWNSLNPAAPVGSTIVPILPQLGSGTRKSFLLALNSSTSVQLTPGPCVVNAEENDPEAIDATGTTNAPNAIEPMSSGRLNMYLGKDSAGTAVGAGYFNDPSCTYGALTPAACTTVTGTAPNTVTTSGKVLAPNVSYQYGASFPTAWSSTRTMYIYFRALDVDSPTIFQPGGTRNWVRTLFYNPCSGTTPAGAPISVAAGNCTGGGLYGPGGAPYIASASGQALVSSAGISPVYTTQSSAA